MSHAEQPIGIFDSGFGGLSVWREVVKLLPNETVWYLGDNAHCPYGSKPLETILELSRANTNLLLEKGCKLIVVACNTATAASIDQLRAEFDIPFIGMEPALKPAALNTETGKVGILATEGTFKSQLFQESRKKYSKNIQVQTEAGYGLVELVENGQADSEQAELLLRSYIDPMLEFGIDHLVLGCTHYPFLAPVIRKILGNRANLVDPAPAVARQVGRRLEEHKMCNISGNKAAYHFSTTGSKERLEVMLASLPETQGKTIATLEHI